MNLSRFKSLLPADRHQALANMSLLERLDLAVITAQELEAQVRQLPEHIYDSLEPCLASDESSLNVANQLLSRL